MYVGLAGQGLVPRGVTETDLQSDENTNSDLGPGGKTDLKPTFCNPRGIYDGSSGRPKV